MESIKRRSISSCQSEDGQSGYSGEPPISPSKSRFPIHLQSSSILESGCKMSVSNNLFYAVLKARFQRTRFLLDRFTDVNSRNDFGYNTLVAALHIEHDVKRDKMFTMLLRHGADPRKKDLAHGRNALSWACHLGREQQVEHLLLDYGGDMDLAERDNDGLTALHHATHAGCMNIVKLLIQTLLKYRLSVDVQDNQGMTPYVHARRLGFKEIAEILRQEGSASPAKSDSRFFKSPREWSQIGKFERQKGEEIRRKEERIRAKIEGRVTRFKFGSPFHGSDLTRIQIPEESGQEKLFVKRTVIKAETESDSVQRETNSLPPDVTSAMATPDNARVRPKSDRLYDEPDGSKGGSQGVAISLIGLSGTERGRIADTFHHSELDTTKVSEYTEMLGGIHALMTILSHEKTPSFRKSVVHEAPPVPKIPQKNKSKVSTLAILFGKEKVKNKRTGRKGKGVKDKMDARKRRQGLLGGKSKQVVLPDIRLNDRAV
ncbi:uncharacterized protein LOC124279562 [Haliotis rubra]|uniref:uncharacterized protein LOC124279562 n=1 Tax=Haliotis rubra TaxID=36100 RepID=UPI001EE53A36|nr:uncharacterized protein LOC124279562 [Haliotis rubra]XP_046571346.1 uncharacterized protein LOC124279562 [Haliotis rubra]